MDLFKTLVFDEVVKAVVVKIVSRAAFLQFGPVAFIVEKVVFYVANQLYEHLSEFVNFKVILLREEAYHRQYIEAVKELRAVAKKGNLLEFEKKREAHKLALARFVRYSR